jgi:hypothetical protein
MREKRELETDGADELPMHADVTVPLNAAVAANVLSGSSPAFASDEQTAGTDQGRES